MTNNQVNKLGSKNFNKNIPIPPFKLNQFIDNVRAIEELAKIKPDVEKLKGYKGFGGLKRCFWDKNLYGQLMRAIRSNFGKEREKEILESLRNSSSSAYYTPTEVINFIYRYLDKVCHVKGGEVLEPACGNGAFFEHMPETMKANSKITGVEYDVFTSKLAKAIHPEINIINNGLQYVDFNGKKFDLIIGNPPYSPEKIVDDFMPDLNGYAIHHYFIAKCMRLLKDDGILALVMPSYWMDIPRTDTRHIIDNESVVIDVIRLPDNLFTQATVTVDIVFIRKTGKKVHDITNITEYSDGTAKDNINEFWLDNPSKVLGELKLKWVEAYKRYVPFCEAKGKEKALQDINNFEFTAEIIENYRKIVNCPIDVEELGDISFKLLESLEELELIKDQAINLIKDVDWLYRNIFELAQRTGKASNIID
ncbi:MAG: hypothetical protein K0R14_786 [Burkholderiales bacterium]|jgi:type I restriction-modification system DNA methylase subunit|nr:hypothetical protein [Burkholderiales bacterium]